ncbi:ADP-ribosylglycohydrolase family protein [uncultured Desulfosarcina sp.]|uniref:ADP-ribosylglycohydrolase family protein n=1 Tax=uncultured Desulfosarcina sp. TaxID=218289 RepID=UPI0029C6143C|nr:ADP-ribosylglycohydrolase family protein [uncultured Desulfosarcina sp.]
MTTPCQKKPGAPDRRSRILGAMLGGAVGDALGAPVADMDIAAIRERYGKAGIFRMEAAYERTGAITDHTRMALFTAEGLILSRVRQEYAREELAVTALYHAYLRWLLTQDFQGQGELVRQHGTCAVVDGVLTGYRELFARRAPCRTCLSALRSGKMGTMDRPVNDSKSNSGLTRVAPVGLVCVDASKAFDLGCASAAITHGHPGGYLAAGFLAALLSRLASGQPLTEAVADATGILTATSGHEECLRAVEKAVAWSSGQQPVTSEVLDALGDGRTAEDALTIALCAALAADRDFRQGALTAVNHSGDSGATAAIAGSILGAGGGADGIPDEWLMELELKGLIEETAMDLFDQLCTLDYDSRYLGKA